MADNPLPPASEPTGPSTRQMLDELDDLMQRMLALPVQPTQNDPSASIPATTPEAPLPPRAERTARAMEMLFEEPVIGRSPTFIPPPPDPELPATEPTPALQPEAIAPTYLPLGAEPLLPIFLPRPKAKTEPLSEQTPTATASAKVVAKPVQPVKAPWLKSSLPPDAPPAATGAAMRALLALNRSFDRSTTVLGPLGRWLRSDGGRYSLGWGGLAMCAGALLWMALWFLS